MIRDILIGAFLGAALTVPGGIWVARRGELGRRLDALEEDIRAMEEYGIRYWRLTGDSEECQGLETKIKLYSFRIGSQITSLNNEFFSFRYSDHFPTMAFRQAVTSHPFEEQGRLADPDRQVRIQTASADLTHKLRMAQRVL